MAENCGNCKCYRPIEPSLQLGLPVYDSAYVLILGGTCHLQPPEYALDSPYISSSSHNKQPRPFRISVGQLPAEAKDDNGVILWKTQPFKQAGDWCGQWRSAAATTIAECTKCDERIEDAHKIYSAQDDPAWECRREHYNNLTYRQMEALKAAGLVPT